MRKFGLGLYDQITAGFMQQSSVYTDSLKLEEWHVYGSSRIGIYQTNKAMAQRTVRIENGITTQLSNTHIEQLGRVALLCIHTERGAKRYELSNHLGNVLTVVTDKKLPICSSNYISYFIADIVSATDYSPFGAPLAERTWQGSEYRYGFNTQERDDEIAGIGNIMTAEFWEYDTRLGKRWNVDPVLKPMESPYLCFGGNPIYHNDPDGDDYGITTTKDKDGNVKKIKVSAKIYIQGDGASSKRAKELTKAAKETFKTKIVDGVEVSFDIKYEYEPEKKVDDLNSKLGENILVFNSKAEQSDKTSRSHINSFTYGGSPQQYTGNTGIIYGSGKENFTVLHESLHLTGLSDRYTDSGGANKGYEFDIMGAWKMMNLKKSHYRNIIEYTKNQQKILIKNYPNLNYIYSNQMLDLKYEGGKKQLKR